MPSVSAAIRQALKEQAAGTKAGVDAMLAILDDLRAQVERELGRAALGSWDAYQLKKMLGAIEGQIEIQGLKAKQAISGLLGESWGAGDEMVSRTLAVAGLSLGFGISSRTVDVLATKDFAEHVTGKLYGDAWDRIKGELMLGVLGGKTPQEVADEIGKNLDDPSIFGSLAGRARAITQTEMGRAFSMAAQARMIEAGKYVEGLEKQWLHAGHPRVAREFHKNLHGMHIPVNEPFLVGSVQMMHPRDPKAPVSEVINCGCAHVPYHEKWAA